MDREQFQQRFKGTPLERPGFDGIRRNAMIVIGNRGDERAIPALIDAIRDPSPMIRGTAAWALGKFDQDSARQALQSACASESDEEVLNEIRAAIQG